MSTNKKFRIQNGVDITGEVVVGNQLVITAEGKLVLPAITEAVNEAVASDLAALQAQVDAILGTSPEHLDTLQEIVALFQSEDGDISTLITNNSTAITQIQQTLASGVATAAQGALADTAAQQADLDAVIAQITNGVATSAQGALADTAIQPEDFGAGISTSTTTVPDWGSTATYTTDSEIATPPPSAYGSASNSTHFAVYNQAYAGGQQVKYMNLYTMSGSPVKNIGVGDDAIATFSETNFALVVSGTATVYGLNGDPVSSWSVPFTNNKRGLAFYGSDKLVVAGQSNSVYVYDWTDGALLSTISISSGAEISSISVSGDKAFVGNWRGGSSNSGQVVIIDLSTNSIESTISNPAGSVNDDHFGLNVESNDTHFAVSRKNETGNFNVGSVEVFKISDNSHTGSVQFPVASSIELGWGNSKQRIQFAEDRILVLGTSSDFGVIVSASIDTPSNNNHVLSLEYPHHSGEMFLSGSDIVILGGNKISKLSTLSGDVITSYGVDTSTIATKAYVDSGVAGVDLSGYTDTSDMTTAIATAQTAAEATAAADATAKADAAQAAAIASASADATAKADQAETDAKAYADQVVAATVDAAPAALDTLNELAAALGDDENFASTVTTSIATKADAAATTAALDSKVDSLKSFTVTGDGITSGTPLTMNTDGTLSKAISGTIASWSKSESDILTGKYSQYIGQESNTKARVGLKTFDNDQKFFLLREGLNEVSLIVGEFDSEGEPQELSSSIFPWRDYYTMATGYTPHSSTLWGSQHTIYTYAFNETSGKGLALFAHNSNDGLIAVGFTVVNDTVIWGSASNAKELSVKPSSGICVSDLQVWSNGYWTNDDRVTPGSGVDPWGGSDFIFHAGESYGNGTAIVGLKVSTTGVVTQSFHRGRSPVAWQYPGAGSNFANDAIMLGGLNHFDNTYYIVKTSQDGSKYNVIVFDMDQYSASQNPIFDDPQATYLELDADIVTGTAFDSTTGNMLVHYYAGGDERLAAYNSGVLVSDTVINSNVGTPPTVLAMTENQRSIEVSDDGLIITSRRENPSATYNNGSRQWQYTLGKLHIETWSSDTSTTPVDSYEVIRPGFTSTTDAGAFWGIKKSNGSIFGLSYAFNHNSTTNGLGHNYNHSSWPSFSFTKSVAQIDSTKYIGIASETPSNDEVSVVISGGISSGHTGLTPSSIYYVQTDGSLGTTQTSLKAGVAISATEIKVSDNLSDALTDLSSYATKDYVDSGVAGVDLSGYSTTAEMDSAIAAIPATDLTPYSTTAQMDAAIAVETGARETAVTSAISTASADATAKADAAQAAAIAAAGTAATQAIADTIDAAPASLDTLNELAAALGDDANFAATVTASLATKADDAATTAALADKVGLAEVDIRMEPIKQLAESAIQAEDFGTGISTVSTTNTDLSVQPSVSSVAGPSNGEFYGNPGTYREDTFVTNGTVSAITSGSGITIFDTATGTQLYFFQGSGSLGHSGAYIGAPLAINSTTLFVVTYMTSGGANNAKLHRINLSDGTYQSSTISPDLGDNVLDMALRGNYLYLSARGAKDSNFNRQSVLLTFDITTGSQTNTVTKESTGGLWGNSFAIEGNILAVANNGAGELTVINIPDGWETSGSTNLIYTIQKPAGLNFAYRVEVSDGKIYVYSENSGWPPTQIGSIHVYDVTDGSLITSYFSETSSLNFGSDFSVMGTALLVSETNGTVATRYILDLSTDLRYEITESFGTDENGRCTNDGTSFYVVGSDGVYTTVSPSGSTSHEYSVDDSIFATKDYVDSGVAGVDLSGYTDTSDMTAAIATAQTAAIASASVDATAKADAAQAAAIASASADATAKANAAQTAAESYADSVGTSAVASVIDAAPATLDTLNELAAALGDDANFAATVTASLATKADDAATTAALADKADDAATTAALADKVGLAEVDIRMEPIKQLAESAIQAEDFGAGISEVSSSVVDWSSLTSADFNPLSGGSELIYDSSKSSLAVDASDTHFVTLQYADGGDSEVTITLHLLNGDLVKTWQTNDYPELGNPWLSYISINGNYISFTRGNNDNQQYTKIYDIRNIDQTDHGLVTTLTDPTLRRVFTIDDTRAIGCYGGSWVDVGDIKVHNISDWAELYSFNPAGVPAEVDFGGGNLVTAGYGQSSSNQPITILKTSGSYGLTGITYNASWHGETTNNYHFGNGAVVDDKYVAFRTQDADGTNRAHVHNVADGSYVRSFIEDSDNPYQVLVNSKGLGKVALTLSGDVLIVPTGSYTSSPDSLYKGLIIYNILTGETLSTVDLYEGTRRSGGNDIEGLYNLYTVSGSTIIDISEEMLLDHSPVIAQVPTTSVTSFGVDTSLFATKDYVDSGVTGNESRLTTAENNLTALEADLSSEENARGAGDAALGLRLDSDKSELDTAIGTLGARLDSDKSELGAAIDAAIEQEVQTPLDLEIGRGSKSLRVGRNTVANTDGGIAIGDAANAAGAKSIALGTSATPTGDNGIEIKTSEAGTLSYSSDSDWSFGAPVTAPSFIGDGSGLTGISSDVTSAIAAEETRATSAESGLQTQISNILSNTDSAALNSLAEIVTEFQNADSTLTGVVGGHGTRLTDLEGRTTDNIPEGDINKYWTEERVKTALTGGLCINDTKLQATGEIAVDEVEAEQSLRVAEAVVSDDTTKLEGQGGSHYRIDIYDVNGTIVN